MPPATTKAMSVVGLFALHSVPVAVAATDLLSRDVRELRLLCEQCGCRHMTYGPHSVHKQALSRNELLRALSVAVNEKKASLTKAAASGYLYEPRPWEILAAIEAAKKGLLETELLEPELERAELKVEQLVLDGIGREERPGQFKTAQRHVVTRRGEIGEARRAESIACSVLLGGLGLLVVMLARRSKAAAEAAAEAKAAATAQDGRARRAEAAAAAAEKEKEEAEARANIAEGAVANRTTQRNRPTWAVQESGADTGWLSISDDQAVSALEELHSGNRTTATYAVGVHNYRARRVTDGYEQENTQTGKKRKLERRVCSTYVPPDLVRSQSERSWSSSVQRVIISPAVTRYELRPSSCGGTVGEDDTLDREHFHKALAAWAGMKGSQLDPRAIMQVDFYENSHLRARFRAKEIEFNNAGKMDPPVWVFHGPNRSDRSVIDKIMQEGFKVGGRDVSTANGSAHGRGIYTATGPQTPLSYNQNRIILAKALKGTKADSDRPGADSWQPKQDWLIFKDGAQLLPRYVLHFT